MFAPYAIDKLPIGIGIGRYHIQNFGEKLKNREGFYFTLMYKNCSSWLKFFLLYSCQFAQAKLGTCQILNFAQNPRQSQSVQGTELNWGGDTAQKKFIPGREDTYLLNRVLIWGGDTAHTFLWG